MSAELETERQASALRSTRGLVRKLGISVLVALGFVWLLQAGALPVFPDGAALRKVSTPHLVLAIAVWAVMFVLRALRWQLLLHAVKPVPTRAVVSVGLLGFAATLLLPLRSGEVVRPLLIRREGVDGWAATGTVGAERVADGLFISLLLLLSLIVAPPRPRSAGDAAEVSGLDPSVISGVAHTAAVLFALASIVIVLFFRFRTLPRHILMGTLGRFRPRAASAIAERIELVASGVGFAARPQIALPFLAVTIIYWGMNAGGIWILAQGLGLSALSPLGACAVLGVLSLGILPPGAPGMFGTFQFAFYAGLSLYFPKAVLESEGAALVFYMYVSQLVLVVLGGLLGLAHVLRSRGGPPAVTANLA